MLGSATLLLALAVGIGSWIAIDALRRSAPPKLAWALLHGIAALAGYVLLILALGGPVRGAAAGAASFGLVAAVTLALAAVPGLLLLRSHLRGRALAGGMIGTHASVAIAGFVILLSYWLLS